jgi:hypothetical protein
MSDSTRKRIGLIGVLVLALLFAWPVADYAQEPANSSAASQTSAQTADLGQVLTELQKLHNELSELHAEVDQLRAQQRSSELESAELKKELIAAKAKEATPDVSTASPISSGPENSETADRIARLEENQQMADQKLAVHDQTKVESGSKYRLRLSGILLFNLFGNLGTVDNIDFPQRAEPQQFLFNDHSFGGSVRQSQIDLQAFGPDIGGARTSADLQFDFAGGFPVVPNGASFGIMRLRTGTVRFDWANTSVIGGQDTLFFAPLAPTSIATLATPPLSYSGNLWSWTPQVRIEHTVTLSDSSRLKLQGGILDPWSGDFPATEYTRSPTWGENSGLPAIAARAAWTQKIGPNEFTLGAGGYYSRQDWGFQRSVDSWASLLDVTMPLGNRFEFTGQFYRGRALGGLAGGIGQSVLWNGSLGDPSVAVHGLDTIGGWAQFKYKATSKLQFNSAFGLDNPFAYQLRNFGSNLSAFYGEIDSKNRSGFVNFIYHPRSDLLFSFEYRRLWTFQLDQSSHNANQLNLSMGYIF